MRSLKRFQNDWKIKKQKTLNQLYLKSSEKMAGSCDEKKKKKEINYSLL